MKFCQKCRTEIENENAKFCPACGAKFDGMHETQQETAMINRVSIDKNVRKIFLFESMSNIFVLLYALIISFLPIVKIGTSSLGNSWGVLISFFENLPENSNELLDYFINKSILVIPAGVIVFFVLHLVGNLVLALITKNNERYCYSVLNHSYIASICTIIVSILECIFFTVATYAFYSIFSQNAIPICILTIVVYVRKMVANYYYCSLIRSSTNKINEYKKYKTVEGKIAFPRMLAGLCHIVTFALFSVTTIIVTLYFGVFKTNVTYLLIPDSVAPTVLTKENASEYHDFYNKGVLSDVISSTSPITKKAYSFNYLFFDSFIKETEEAIKQLMPEDYSEEGWKRYFARLEDLKSDIEIAKEMRDKQYLYTETMLYSSEPYYNFTVKESLNMKCENDSKSEKWGVDVPWYMFGGEESITLSQTVFSQSTDFNERVILAYVTYADGSVRFSIITPDNANELNKALPGSHMLVWTDDWGTYEAEIKIR